MSTIEDAQRKRKAKFLLALLIILIGGSVMYKGDHDPRIRAFGLAIVLLAVQIGKVANDQYRASLNLNSVDVDRPKSSNALTRVLWIVSLCLVPILGIAWYLLDSDARHGGHVAWPAGLFAGVGLVCAVVWSISIVLIRQGRGRSK